MSQKLDYHCEWVSYNREMGERGGAIKEKKNVKWINMINLIKCEFIKLIFIDLHNIFTVTFRTCLEIPK